MKEIGCNVWSKLESADALCITTSFCVDSKNALVMGRGIASQAKTRFPGIEYAFGFLVLEHGQRLHVVRNIYELPVISFPVKYAWYERADMDLIRTSAEQLVELTDEEGWQRVLLPRPGCGNGKLKWREVRPILSDLLDDRFVVVSL